MAIVGSRGSRAANGRQSRRRLGWLGWVLAGSLGCRQEPPPAGEEPAEPDVISANVREPTAFQYQAHAEALARLRSEVLPLLRLLDPVSSARLEGAPLRPPAFGARARAARREALERASKEAEGLDAKLLEPTSVVTLWMLEVALERARAELARPPWRDDPGAILHALEPYFAELQRRVAERRCDDDDCGLGELGPALTAAFDEVGSASVAATAAARQDLAARRALLRSSISTLGPEHALFETMAALETTFDAIDAELATAEQALPAAAEVPWTRAVPPAPVGSWSRRPARWGASTLREWLERNEAYGRPPEDVFPDVLTVLARLQAMRGGEVEPHAPLPRPFDEAACTSTFESIAGWVQAQRSHLKATLECGPALRRLSSPAEGDAAIFLHLVEQGVVQPTREAVRGGTGIDVAMVSGRASARAQLHLLDVSVTAGLGRRDAARLAIDRAHHEVCMAAVATWIHGELGDEATLGERLAPHGCGELPPLVAEAEARPRAALRGLGMLLVGQGPADAAALDRYWWAPLGLVASLARPPAPQLEPLPRVKIYELDPASPTLPIEEGGKAAPAASP